MQRSDFAYELPPELIAQAPLPVRERSRLLCVGEAGTEHRQFSELPAVLNPGDLLVVNDTAVIKARLRGVKDSGGRVEILVERIESERVALCQARSSKPLRPGRTLDVRGGRMMADQGIAPRRKTGRTVNVLSRRVIVLERSGEFFRLKFPAPVAEFLERYGETPLPPYIERAPEPGDSLRYQTVYATRPGAVAAPTAGLHFSEALFEALEKRGVGVTRITLHVGAGTFQPVRVDDLSRHRMHSERYEISDAAARSIRACRERGGRVVAVGTTVVRALESAVPQPGGTCAVVGETEGSRGPGEFRPSGVRAGTGETSLFITPGYRFKIVDALLTNFHLPESTLLMLVCAFAGYERVMSAYATAVANGYRFFSYGDAMFTERRPDV